MNNAVMMGKDAISAPLAECYATIDGKRYNLMQAINLEATMEKVKTEVPILGKTGKGNKANGWTGSGSATFHYNTSIFRKIMLEYARTGKDLYFDMVIINSDPTSAVGEQTIVLKGCNLDSIVVAKFDADGEYLDEELDFTFESWEMPQEFAMLDGMM